MLPALALLFPWPAFADPPTGEKTRLAVLDFAVGAGLQPDDGKTLATFVRGAIVRSGRIEVMDRQQMVDVLTEQRFSQAICEDTKSLVKAGKLLDVNRVMAGRVAKFGNRWTLAINLVDVSTGKLINSSELPYDGQLEDLLNFAPGVGLSLLNLGGAAGASGQPATSTPSVSEKTAISALRDILPTEETLPQGLSYAAQPRNKADQESQAAQLATFGTNPGFLTDPQRLSATAVLFWNKDAQFSADELEAVAIGRANDVNTGGAVAFFGFSVKDAASRGRLAAALSNGPSYKSVKAPASARLLHGGRFVVMMIAEQVSQETLTAAIRNINKRLERY